MVQGRRRDIGLGGFPLVSLAEAREQAFDNRRLIRAGGDPLAEKRREKVPTFREAARKTLEANRARWKNDGAATIWMQQMEKHAFPKLGNVPVGRIGGPDVLRVLIPLWTAKPDTARKLRQRIRATLTCAQAYNLVEHNAACEGIDGALPTMPTARDLDAPQDRSRPRRSCRGQLRSCGAASPSETSSIVVSY